MGGGDADPGAGPAFRVLGAVAASDAAGACLDLGPPRWRAVLAALLVRRGGVVSVDQLIDLVWDGRPPATASTMVHGAVAGLRRRLGPVVLETHRGGYVLQLSPAQLDAARFEELLAWGRALVETTPSAASRLLTDASALWDGPAFAGVEQRFARDAATRLEALQVDCAELRIDADVRQGRHREVLDDLLVLAARHPWRERLCALSMVALYRCGRQSEALAAYRTLRRRLMADHGLRPGPELQRLEAAVLRHSEDLDGAVRTGPRRRDHARLPVPVGPFVGRRRERDELEARLREDRLVTLTGPGGAGKTRLAVEVARGLAGSGTDVVLVDVAVLSDAALVEPAVAEALGLHLPAGRDLAWAVAEALTDDVLVVLDNVEHLLEECATLARAVCGATGHVRVLATSRRALGVPGERVHPVPPLVVAPAGAPHDEILACDAVRLFAARASAAHPGFALTPDNAELVRRLCAGLDGLPLALELAAARAASMPLPDLAARLHDRFRLLDAAAPGVDRRHRGLRATVAWSHDLLSRPEQALLGGLSVFPAPFTLAAAEAVGRAVGVPPEDTAILTAHLVAASAVQLEDAPGDVARYRVLETTRQFADEGLAPDVRRRLREHHARYYADLADEASAHLFAAGSAPWLAVLHRERAHLRAALEWSSGPEGDGSLGGRLVRSMWHYWDLRGARAEGLRWVHTALAVADVDGPAERLPLLSAGALLHMGRAEFEATATLATEQLSLARASADLSWEGDALAMLATVAWARGRYDRAQQLYEDGARASLAGGDTWRAAMEEAQLARLHRDRQEPDAAAVTARRARDHADQVGEELARGLALDVLASLEHLWGDAAEARRLVARALEHYRAVTYREGEASAGALAGRIALAAHDLDAARVAFEGSRTLSRRIGHRAGVVAALEGLAEVAGAAADHDEARGLSETAAALRAEIGLAAGAISRR